jgi:hypothetical protein
MTARFVLQAGTVVIILLTLVAGCTSSVYHDVYPTLSDGRYDSEFPYRGCSRQLEEISETVNMVSSIAYYRTYMFLPEERLMRGAVTAELLKRKEGSSVYVNSTASGTVTTLQYQDHRVLLVTCAHVVDFQDTVVEYHISADRRPTDYIKSIAVKEKQSNYAAVFPEGGELEVLALDRVADIALLGRKFETDPAVPLATFKYPFGRARELEWGTFVYLFGYPSGYKMATKGIVSSPNKDKRGTFMVDAMFSRGFSGGIVLAIRDGVPNFECVGMIKLVSAHTSYVLIPEKDGGDIVFDPAVPYTGEIFVERHTEIESGITQAVPAESILEFLRTQESGLLSKGYVLGPSLKGDR